MFISGYFEFEALNKYSRGAVKKVLICMELKKKKDYVIFDVISIPM